MRLFARLLMVVTLTLPVAAKAARRTVAIAPLTTVSSSEYQWIGAALAEALSARVLNQTQLNGLTVRQVRTAMEENNIEPVRLGDSEVAQRLGRDLGADLVVVGTYVASWPDLDVVLRLFDPATGKLLSTESVSGELCKLVDVETQLASVLSKALKSTPLDARPGAFGTVVIRAWRELTLAQEILVWQSLNPRAADHESPLSLPGTAVQQAKRHLESALRIDPTYGEAYALLGLAEALLGQAKSSDDAFAKARKLNNGESPTAVLGQSFVRMRQGRYDDAAALLHAAGDARPGFLHAWGSLGELYNHVGRYKDGLATFQQYVATAPRQPWALAMQGYSKSKLGDHLGAITDSIKAVDMLPDSPALLIELASRYIDAGKLIGAEDALTHALKEHPKEARAYTRLGYVYLLQNKDEMAIALSEKALVEAEFGNRRRERAYAHLNLARAYGRRGELDKAFSHLQQANEHGPVPLSQLNDDPRLAAMRADPRFRSLAK